MTSLAFDQVRVDYAKRTAVASFTDTVKPGEWLCIIGPNGAGSRHYCVRLRVSFRIQVESWLMAHHLQRVRRVDVRN